MEGLEYARSQYTSASPETQTRSKYQLTPSGHNYLQEALVHFYSYQTTMLKCTGDVILALRIAFPQTFSTFSNRTQP